MKVWSFPTRPIQLNMYLLYFLPDRRGQLVTPFPDDDINDIFYDAMPNTWGENGRTEMQQLLTWYYPLFGRIL